VYAESRNPTSPATRADEISPKGNRTITYWLSGITILGAGGKMERNGMKNQIKILILGGGQKIPKGRRRRTRLTRPSFKGGRGPRWKSNEVLMIM
jgi:hypothetical protein